MKTNIEAQKPAAPQSSPFPWRVWETSSGYNIDDANRFPIMTGKRKEDAALIVRRVNQGPAFDAIVEAVTASLAVARNLREIAAAMKCKTTLEAGTRAAIHKLATDYTRQAEAALKIAQESK